MVKDSKNCLIIEFFILFGYAFKCNGGNMTAQIQLDFFKETTDDDVLRAELAALKDSHDKVRRRAFAQIGTLTKMLLDQQQEIDFLKMHAGLCCALEK